MKKFVTSVFAALATLFVPSIAAQTPLAVQAPLSAQDKLKYHAGRSGGLLSLTGSAAVAGVVHGFDTPREWGQGAEGFGRRMADEVGTGIARNIFAFGLDTALGEDPRYVRSERKGFFPRLGHVVAGTFTTRTDAGGTRFATWRFGSAYGAGYLETTWYPERLRTPYLGLEQGSLIIGGDLLVNFGHEFWTDIRRKVFRR